MSFHNSSTVILTRKEAEKKTCRRAAHCMFFAETESQTIHQVPVRALIMMQVRFDGFLGFAGGLIDPGESIEEGLNRELKEEINLDINKIKVTSDDLQEVTMPYSDESSELVCYFYAKKITESQFKEIEIAQLNAIEWGKEVI